MRGEKFWAGLAAILFFLTPNTATAQEGEFVDWLSFAQGAILEAFGGDEEIRAASEQGLLAIDGNSSGYGATPKPGGPDASIWFIYRLPAKTTFSKFGVPKVYETPSPSQTFFRDVQVSGSTELDGPYEPLGTVSLSTHADDDEVTWFPATADRPVKFVKLTLTGGIDVQTERTFFEFSEIIGEGVQEPVLMLETFDGKWSGRGVKIELKQDGATVTGCYDGVGDLNGIVSGNLLRATGANRDTGVPSTFVLTIDDESLTGVRSANGAPFRLYEGEPNPDLVTECSEREVSPPGCGAVVHGILFGYDSDEIREESGPVLDALYAGLMDEPQDIDIVGHTSSEGSDTYNLDLSERRAAAVLAALIERGLAGAGLSSHGEGEAQPIADNSTEAGRSLNRRVEVICQ